MLDQNQIIIEWTKYPTGKIRTGEFCPHCGRYNARNTTATAIGIFNNQVLLIKRKRDPEANMWAMPGGYLDWGETLEQCSVREFKEETSLDLIEVKFVGLYDSITRDKDGRQNVDHCFVGTVKNPDLLAVDPNEVIEARWFPFNQLPDTMAFDHGQMLKDYYGRFSNQ